MLNQEIIEAAKDFCADYSTINPNWIQATVFSLLDLDRAEYQLSSIENDLKINSLRNIKVLEVGSGLGSFLMAARNKEVDCYGIEPDEIGIQTSIKRMPELEKRIAIGVGENLPYNDGTFDLVVSFQVLEHTQDPQKVLQESIRVLKKGGYLYFVIPNYNSFWEGHYGLHWLPSFPKPLAKLYVRIHGRDAKFLNNIQYITPKMLLKILSFEDVELVSMGLEKWEERLDSLDFPTWGHTRRLMLVAKFAIRLKVGWLIKVLGRKFALYYPIVLIVRKT